MTARPDSRKWTQQRLWLVTPCEGPGGLKPVEMLERGEAERLWRVVLLIGSGDADLRVDDPARGPSYRTS